MSTDPSDTLCVIGLPCARHSGAVHGSEAEELRSGVERILGNVSSVKDADAPFVLAEMRKTLQRLLDHVDARDSLAYLEKLDALQELADAVTDADILALPREVQEARLAYQFPPTEAKLDALQELADAVTEADILALPREVQEARRAYQFPPTEAT
jgi:hypothetical protein